MDTKLKLAEHFFESTSFSDAYIKHRPRYPDTLFSKIRDVCMESNSSFQLAVDIGCGDGRTSIGLCPYFSKVIGIDISESQLATARKLAAAAGQTAVEYQIGKGENLSSLDDASVDLVTIGTAIHWMVEDDVYKEVKRVLKPCGVFIVFGYGCHMLEKKDANDFFWKFYSERMHQYNANPNYIYNILNDYELPFKKWIRDYSVKMQENWSTDDLNNYLKTVSPGICLLEADPQTTAFQDLQKGLKKYMCTDDKTKEGRMKVTWPITMLIAWNQSDE